ncbi:hypothetical protein pmac_cds_835 [Pandoravirus macleodensis]|uniref:Uncharacterized protein n=1 Tax=Pandoravirus macleodensis TaxID=2107707 RepID=A0A2U7UG96_9VIRU|nr:hypothetical protein pmac_cds_835 [Pandoravirus macleodensis]AVK77523.1 hypothetical protein pmac_cds_835 [Pandoravirus macleodensis]UMO80329.1 hypothetical protein [Pandoravirus aubagnensis]
MSDTIPAVPKRRFAKRTNRGLRAASIAAAAIESLMPSSVAMQSSETPAVPTAAPAIDIMDVANETAPACGADSAPPDAACTAKDSETPPESDVVAAAPIESAQGENTPLDDGDLLSASACIALFDSVLADPETAVVSISCSKQKRSRDCYEPAGDAPVSEDLQGPSKKGRIDPDDQADQDHDGSEATACAVENGVDATPDDAENHMDVAAAGLPAHESFDTDGDNGYNREGAIDELGNRESRDRENEQEQASLYDEKEAMRAYEASVAGIDCYKEATKRNGIKRLYILIEYLTALVGCGHCASFEIGPETPSLKRVTFGAVREGCVRVGTVQRIGWSVRGGSVPATKGTALQPFGTAVGSLVADPNTLHALYTDWAPALSGQRPSSMRDCIVLRFALTRGADRQVACRPLARLLDDCLDGADAQAALPAARQRVSVRLDALWRRYLAHDDIIKKAALQAALYRCGMTTTATTRPSTAMPITPGLVAAS